MVTANAMRQHRDQALAAGANSHLAKPFTPVSLMNAIEQALSEAPSAEAADDSAPKSVVTATPAQLSTDEKLLGMF
jgi:DNA-binding response OmpR family regulator